MATKTRRPEEKIVRYRTLVDRFRTKNSEESFNHLVFTSCLHKHLFIWWGFPVTNVGQVQRMAQILHLKRCIKFLETATFLRGVSYLLF